MSKKKEIKVCTTCNGQGAVRVGNAIPQCWVCKGSGRQ